MESHAIVIADTAGTIRIWSEGAERLFGHRVGAAIGHSLDLIVPPAFRERIYAASGSAGALLQ